jgi:hypothetical protein
VGVDQGCADVGVAEDFLNRSDVCAGLEEMGCEGMSERVAAHLLGDAGLSGGLFDGALQDGFVKVVTVTMAGSSVGVDSGCREDPLPRPFATGTSIFLDESVGEGDVACAVAKVALVLCMDVFEVGGKALTDGLWEKSNSIFASLARSYGEMTGVEVDVFDTEVRAFEKP